MRMLRLPTPLRRPTVLRPSAVLRLPASARAAAAVLRRVASVFAAMTATAFLAGAALAQDPLAQGTANDAANGVQHAAGAEGTPPPAAFLFALPDEVKTGAMLLLAAAIGIYLYINYTRDR